MLFIIMFQVSYCDSRNYSAWVNSIKGSKFFNFITNIVASGISASTYSSRADLIMTFIKPKVQKLEYNNILAQCDDTISHVINAMLQDYPSITEDIKCSEKSCQTTSQKNHQYITFQVTSQEDINGLQNFLIERTKIKYLNCAKECGGMKTINTNVSKTHLFIDILHWEGKIY